MLNRTLTYAIVQPTPFCNINCSYCYLPDRSSTKRMTVPTFEKTLQFLHGKPGLLTKNSALIWHCGEPLSAGLDFYREAYAVLEKSPAATRSLTTCFSTNATLITQEWCDLFRSIPRLRIRVSLDGPEYLHNASRVRRDGTGTFDAVMRGVELLNRNSVPFEILCVLREKSLGLPDEMWEFFLSMGPKSIGFCVEEVLGEHKLSTLQHSLAQNRVRAFFRRLMDLRDTTAPDMLVREVDDILRMMHLHHLSSDVVRDDNVPLKLISIAWDGSVSLFSPELLDLKDIHRGNFHLGNVYTHTIDEILESEAFRTLHGEITEGVNRCRESCSYFRLCGGGFPVSKFLENGTFNSAETLTCRLRVKAICDAVLQNIQLRQRSRLAPSLLPNPTVALPVNDGGGLNSNA